MAGIDKIYISNYEDYLQFREYCRITFITLVDGNKLHLFDYIRNNLTEEDFKGDTIPVSNFPTGIDIYLIRNCPLEFIQERLMEQYSSCYQQIKDYESEYDLFQRNGKRQNIKFTIKKPRWRCNAWHVEIYKDDIKWLYNEKFDSWYHPMEQPTVYNTTACFWKNCSIKKIKRKLKKWNLPAGLTIKIYGIWVGQEYLITTK